MGGTREINKSIAVQTETEETTTRDAGATAGDRVVAVVETIEVRLERMERKMKMMEAKESKVSEGLWMGTKR